ncbi:hypothetical protein Tco_0480449 [Tanacetum coccineum]
MAKPISNKAQEQNPAEPRDKSNVKIKFSKELLTELQNNTFSRRCEDDVIKHIGKPLSCASNYDKMSDDDEEGRDPLEFILWRNSKFKDHKQVDETTKRALLYTLIEIGKEEELLNKGFSSRVEWEKLIIREPPTTHSLRPYLNNNK